MNRRWPSPSIISSVKPQTNASTRSGITHFRSIEVDGEGAHLVLQARESAGVVHPALFVKRAGRLGTSDFTA
jgi:hypothetical protein